MHQLSKVPNINDLNEINPTCKAILWDMDGTIMETEVLHITSLYELLKTKHPDNQIELKTIEEVCYGQTDPKILDSFQEKGYLTDLTITAFIEAKDKIIEDLLSKTQIERIFNVQIRNFMVSVNQLGIKQAVVTSSEKNITHILLKHLGILEFFEFIITREDTSENKPSPMPYVTAMKKLDLEARHIVIFEDSTLGLQAALNSKAPFCRAKWYANQI